VRSTAGGNPTEPVAALARIDAKELAELTIDSGRIAPKGEALFKELESVVQGRLWNSATDLSTD
jgi:hypothetical protein